jgi:hypothetical protein
MRRSANNNSIDLRRRSLIMVWILAENEPRRTYVRLGLFCSSFIQQLILYVASAWVPLGSVTTIRTQ